jgi:hypothetical protein
MLETKIITNKGHRIAVIQNREIIIHDTQSVLDLIATTWYSYQSNKIAINKEAIVENFFKLSTGFAGETIQKFVNYDCQLAIIGNFSHYTSQSLRNYIYESNKGRHLFFVKDEIEAVKFLSQ